MRLIRVILLVSVTLGAFPAFAQITDEPDPWRFLTWPVQDGMALIKSAGSEKAIYALVLGGGFLVMARYDNQLSDVVTPSPGSPWYNTVRVVEEFGNVNAVRPAAAILAVGSFLSKDTRFQDAAITSVESVVFADLITCTLKGITGRARPKQDRGHYYFDPFSGNTSFPSGHSTAVFALITPWLMYYPGWATSALMIVGAGTAMSRVIMDEHWMSDVLAGSSIGLFTGYWLSRRHIKSRQHFDVSPWLAANGAGITLRIPL